jgi:hypothetical protein
VIRVQKWQGFITYASPYLIPAGGATEQTNMVCLLPGQISCRGGMEKVLDTTGAALEMWGFSVGNDTDKIFIFTDSGDIRIEDAPVI